MKETKIRIYDKEVIKEIEILKMKKGFNSTNEVINHLIKRGLENTRKENESGESLKDFEKEFKNKMNILTLKIDEIYIQEEINKTLLSNIYNIKLEELDGEKIDRDLVETGAFGHLPEGLEKIERRMLKKRKEIEESGDSI